MKPFVFASIRVDVTLPYGGSLNERGAERLADAIAEVLDGNDLQHAVYQELAKLLPGDLMFELEIQAREVPVT